MGRAPPTRAETTMLITRHGGRITDPFLPQMKSLVEQSRGEIRGDVVNQELVALG